MFQESALRLLNVHCSLLLALSLSAAAGWGSFALARHTSTEMEHQLRDQAASLQTSQTQLAAERTKTQASLSEMAQLRAELVAARSEMNQLSQSREQVPVEFSPVRPNGKSANIRSDDTNDDVSRTGAIGGEDRPGPEGQSSLSETASQSADCISRDRTGYRKAR